MEVIRHSAIGTGYRPYNCRKRFIGRPSGFGDTSISSQFTINTPSPGGIEAYGRCIGHGGMPVERGVEPDMEECRLLAWDNRRYENGEPINVGYNGHANLSFDG